MSSDMQISTMMAKRENQDSEKAQKKKKISIQSVPAVSHLCLHAIYCMLHQTVKIFSICFLRIKVVSLLSRGCIWVDKVSNPARRTGI